MKTGACDDPSLSLQVYIFIVTLCSHLKRYLSPVSKRFFLINCENLNKDLQHYHESKSHSTKLLATNSIFWSVRLPETQSKHWINRICIFSKERLLYLNNNRDLCTDIFFVWALMIFLFVFPKHGTEVQMSDLTFEELIKDEECPADMEMKGSMAVSVSTWISVLCNIHTNSAPQSPGQGPGTPSTHFIALMDVVIYHLKQKPHHIPQDERGDQVPVDNIPQASDTPEQGNTLKWAYSENIHTHISNCMKEM